jgi:hypothetical protein
MKATKILTASALALVLATPASAQVVLQSWDIDGDGVLTGAEFRSLFTDNPTMAAIDADNDGTLTEAEYDAFFAGDIDFADTRFASFEFSDWDENADGLVEESEMEQGFLTVYDNDSDGQIDESEFTAVSSDFDAIGTDL